MSKKIQQQFLDSLVVERISVSKNLSVLLGNFSNEINTNISNILKNGEAMSMDDNNVLAVYVIRTSDQTLELLDKELNFKLTQNIILLYFALQPGLLIEPLFTENQIIYNLNFLIFVTEYLMESDIGKRKEMFDTFLKQHPEISAETLNMIVLDYGVNVDLRLSSSRYSTDIPLGHAVYSNTEKHVANTIGAFELALFCANQSPLVKNLYKRLQFAYPMGCLFYWYYIFPTILSAVDIVSGQYIYLYAADNSICTDTEHTLIGYYEKYLHFTTDPGWSPIKPLFDCGCVFMWQCIIDAKNYYLIFREDIMRDDDLDPNAILI